MIPLKTAKEKFTTHLKAKGKASATIVAYSKDIDQLLNHAENVGRTLIHEVREDDINQFLQKLGNTNYTPKSISRKINATKTFFKFLIDEKVIAEDPARNVKHPKLDPKKPRIFSSMEYRALRDAAKDDVRSAAMIEVLLQLGLRISELANIKITDIEFSKNPNESGKLSVPQVETKIERVIPLNCAAQKALKAYLEVRANTKKDYVFVTKTGNPLLIRNIRATIDRLFKKAGIQNAKVNDLRHTFVVHHLRAGVNLVMLSKIAGHKRISTTEKYLEYVEEKTAKNSDKLELGEL